MGMDGMEDRNSWLRTFVASCQADVVSTVLPPTEMTGAAEEVWHRLLKENLAPILACGDEVELREVVAAHGSAIHRRIATIGELTHHATSREAWSKAVVGGPPGVCTEAVLDAVDAWARWMNLRPHAPRSWALCRDEVAALAQGGGWMVLLTVALVCKVAIARGELTPTPVAEAWLVEVVRRAPREALRALRAVLLTHEPELADELRWGEESQVV